MFSPLPFRVKYPRKKEGKEMTAKDAQILNEIFADENEEVTTSDVCIATRASRNRVVSVPLFVPRHFIVVAGVGVTEIENETLGLEAALLAAKIDHLNLVRLTSALPKYPQFVFADEAKIVIPVATPTPTIYHYSFVKAKRSGKLTVGLEFFQTLNATIVIEAEEPLCKAKLPGLVHCGHSLLTLEFKRNSLVDVSWEFRFSSRQFEKTPSIHYFSDTVNGKYVGVFTGILVLP
jgi:hypothetical protein